MKRFVFASVLLLLVLGFNIYCLCAVKTAKNDVIMRLDEISSVIEKGDSSDRIAEKAEVFMDYWKETQDSLSRIIRHDLLDRITSSSAAFYDLATYGETGELSAEISRCKVLMEEIWDSERPLLRNIF